MSVPAALAAPLLSTFAAPLPATLVAAPLPWRSLLQRRPRPLTLLDGGSGDAFFGEAAVRATLDDFKAAAPSMFGGHPDTVAIGITGDIALAEVDGPVVVLSLSGRFWHKRETVLANAGAFLRQRWPEICDVIVGDPGSLRDVVRDDETGDVLEDRRAPDWNGDRAALEYQGIDPDRRGPFPERTGGFRAGGSMFS